MSTVALILAALAALAVIVLVIRMMFLIRRVQQVWDRLGRTIESDLSPGIRAWGEVAQGVRKAAGKLDDDLTSLGRTLQRAEQLSEKLDTGLLFGSTASKLSSWLAGVRRGLAKPHQHPHTRVKGSVPSEDEAEPGD